MGPETGLLTLYSQVVTIYTDRCYTIWLRIMPQIAFMFYVVQYLGTTLTDQNSIQEEIKSRLFGAESFVLQVAIQKRKD